MEVQDEGKILSGGEVEIHLLVHPAFGNKRDVFLYDDVPGLSPRECVWLKEGKEDERKISHS